MQNRTVAPDLPERHGRRSPTKITVAGVLVLVGIAQVFLAQLLAVFGNLRWFPYLQYASATILYLVLATLLWLDVRNLEELGVDRWTLVLFIISAFLRRRLGVVGEGYFVAIIAAAGLAIITAIVVRRPLVPKTRVSWALVGFLSGALLAIALILQKWLGDAVHWRITDIVVAAPAAGTGNIVLAAIRALIYQVSFVAPVEELLFRGFLFGYLQRWGLSEGHACWVQGAVFWMLHWPKLVMPLDFLVGAALASFTFSLLVFRSKQVFASTVAHLVVNTISMVV